MRGGYHAGWSPCALPGLPSQLSTPPRPCAVGQTRIVLSGTRYSRVGACPTWSSSARGTAGCSSNGARRVPLRAVRAAIGGVRDRVGRSLEGATTARAAGGQASGDRRGVQGTGARQVVGREGPRQAGAAPAEVVQHRCHKAPERILDAIRHEQHGAHKIPSAAALLTQVSTIQAIEHPVGGLHPCGPPFPQKTRRRVRLLMPATASARAQDASCADLCRRGASMPERRARCAPPTKGATAC